MRLAIPVLALCVLGAGFAAAPALAQQAVSAELIRLHDDLHLSAGQEAAWTTYTRAVAPRSDADARHKATEDLLPSLTTPRRIALIAATMAADEADFRRQGAAVTAFYAVLTPSQQRTFDRETLSSQNAQRQPD